MRTGKITDFTKREGPSRGRLRDGRAELHVRVFLLRSFNASLLMALFHGIALLEGGGREIGADKTLAMSGHR